MPLRAAVQRAACGHDHYTVGVDSYMSCSCFIPYWTELWSSRQEGGIIMEFRMSLVSHYVVHPVLMGTSPPLLNYGRPSFCCKHDPLPTSFPSLRTGEWFNAFHLKVVKVRFIICWSAFHPLALSILGVTHPNAIHNNINVMAGSVEADHNMLRTGEINGMFDMFLS